MTVFSPILPFWQKSEEPWSLNDLLHPDPENPPKYMLQARDLDILQVLLEHRFMTTHQVNRMFFNSSYGQRATQRRMKQLFEMGLIMRIRPKDLEPGTKPYVFAITQLGYQLLIRVERISSEVRFEESEHQVEFSRIIHEIDLNNVCLDILESADQRDVSVEWIPTKQCRQRVKMPDGKYRVVEPDAVFVFGTNEGEKILHVEYERSADPDDFRIRW